MIFGSWGNLAYLTQVAPLIRKKGKVEEPSTRMAEDLDNAIKLMWSST